MAILNYSKNYSDISNYILSQANVVGANDLLKLFFAPDANGAGHLITHGIDFTPDYTGGKRGLVPRNGKTLNTSYLRGDGWASLWSLADENTAKDTGANSTEKDANYKAYLASTLVSAGDIKNWIDNSFSLQDAMRFKGTIEVSNTTVIGVNGGSGGFPTTCEIGDTYKVSGSGTLAGQVVSTGDLLIAYADGKVAGSVTTLNSANYWTVVLDNVEALVTHTVNGTPYHLYSQDSNLASGWDIFAPTTSGASNNLVLFSVAGGTPTWHSQSDITAGAVSHSLSGGAGILLKNSGNQTVSYNGSAAVTVSLAVASTTQLGGIIIDGGTHGYATSGTTTNKPTISVTSTGEVYITKANIENALGYTPGASTSSVGKFAISASATGTSTATAAQNDPYVNLIATDGSTVLANFKLNGGTGIAVASTANANTINIALKTATSSTIGGIKIHKANLYAVDPHTSNVTKTIAGTAYDSKYYGVELDSNNAAFVNVPWISDVFNVATEGKGLVEAKTAANTAANALTSSTYILGSDAKWYKLPGTAFEGTWRTIKVNGTEILGSAPKDASGNDNPALNLVGSDKVTVSGNTDGTVSISAAWREIFAEKGTSHTLESIGDNALAFADSDGIWTHVSEEDYTVGTETKKRTVVKSYLVWYNLDDNTYDGIV